MPIIMLGYLWLSLRMLVLSTHKIWPNFKDLKNSTSLALISIVTTLIIYAEFHKEFEFENLKDFVRHKRYRR